MAMGSASSTSSTRIGIITVSVAGSRVAKRLLTASLVAQLLPQSKVTICLTNSHSWYQTGSSRPSVWRMALICSGLAFRPPSTSAGSPPKYLNRKNTSSTTPRSVGIICHRRRMR